MANQIKPEDKFRCPRCFSHDITLGRTKSQTWVYCDECGTRIAKISGPTELYYIYKKIREKPEFQDYAIKAMRKYGDNINIRCDVCKCLLYSSQSPQPEGQFNLIDANYCPVCGSEFLDSMKKMSRGNMS